jgi:hypothetical protein
VTLLFPDESLARSSWCYVNTGEFTPLLRAGAQ